MACSILASMSDDADDDQSGGALVEVLAGLLEVLAAHAGRGVAGDGAEDGAARGGAGEEAGRRWPRPGTGR